MAARYVNPDNVTAQGQYFYTGLLPGSYDTAGAGGGNVYGAGSGGSAGVSADRTGSDSKKTWDYQSKWEKPAGKSDKDEILDAIAGLGDPGASAPPDGGEDPPRGKRKPVSNGGPQDIERYKGPFIPGTTTPERIRPDWDTAGGLLGGDGGTPNFDAATAPKPLQLGPGPSNQGPPTSNQGPDTYVPPEKMEFPGGNAWENWEKRSDAAKKGASGRKRPDRKMPAKDAIWGMTQIANADGTQGMWGAFTSSSASRAHSRPRTF
jgi:hypothetical protein